ncbi:hypothetical protein FB451DRAFT_1557398 [Mycena latifolia]|nr:hypothetical protein FB451DRAFT_1557398 [Mycena latifolia]
MAKDPPGHGTFQSMFLLATGTAVDAASDPLTPLAPASTMYCDLCVQHVHVGTGGESNLESRGRPHNLSSLDNVPQVYEMAPGEMAKMQQLWLDRQNYPKKRNLKNKSANPLRLSDAHLARNAITSVKRHPAASATRASDCEDPDSEDAAGTDPEPKYDEASDGDVNTRADG